MSYDYNKTHELILKSAEEQFKKEGFRNASIRRICSDAGVTNGAFYAHFDSKEALFKELVGPAVEGLSSLYDAEKAKFFKIESKEDIIRLFEDSFSSSLAVADYIYAHTDSFRLILSAAGGTEYENFAERLSLVEAESTAQFFEMCKPYIGKPENLSPTIMEVAGRLMVSAAFDSFKKGVSRDETVREIRLASEFCLAGFKKIWDI